MSAVGSGPRWIVDGMNVIGAVPDRWWRDRAAAMGRLVSAIDAWAQREGESVSVVLDGRPKPVGEPILVEVTFAGSGRDAADRVIAEAVEAHEEPGALRVVTSDRQLAERVGVAGAAIVSARSFRRLVGMRG